MIKNVTTQTPTFLHWQDIPVNSWFRLGMCNSCVLHYKINETDSFCLESEDYDKKLVPYHTKNFMLNNSQGQNKIWQLCDVTEIQFRDKQL